jgi:NitT/TauT family transport system substrate-binding protein
MTAISRRTFGTLAIAAAGTALVGCSSDDKSTKPKNKNLDDVTYVTGFGQFGREGYVYVADAKGYFAEQGIKVKVLPGNAGNFNIQQLDANKAQFTILDFTKALSLLGAGHNTFKIVAPIQQQTIAALMTLEGRGITNPPDLSGKKLVQAPGTVIKILFPAYAKEAGFDPNSVHWLPDVAQTQLVPLLLSRQADAIGQFVVAQPAVQAAAAALPGSPKPVALPYSKVISDLYGNVMVAPASLVSSNPDLVRRFSTALLKGLYYAVQNPKESGDIIQKAAPTTKAVVAAAELTLMASYTGSTGPNFGVFDPSRLIKGIALMEALPDEKGQPLVPPSATLTPDKILATGATPAAGIKG